MIYLSKGGGAGADSDHTWIRPCSIPPQVELEPIEIWNTVVWGSILGWVNLFSYNM